MASVLLLSDPALFALVRLDVDEGMKMITATTTAQAACCPLCQQPSRKVVPCQQPCERRLLLL